MAGCYPWRSGRRIAERAEAAALGGEAREQRRGFEALFAGQRRPFAQALADMGEADRVGIEHRPAPPRRKSVAVDPDHVDVAGPARDSLLENARSLVDHWKDHPLHDLVGADRAAGDAEARRGSDDQLLDLRVRHGRARSLAIEIEAAAGFLPEPAHLAQPVGDLGAQALRLAHAPADVEPGE